MVYGTCAIIKEKVLINVHQKIKIRKGLEDPHTLMIMEIEESEDNLIPCALLVDDGADDDFDLEIPPTTGNEYLRRVRQEAKGCPDIVVADIDTAVFKHKQTIKVSKPVICCPAPKGLAPSLAWQKQQIHKFVETRQNFINHKAIMKKENVKPVKVPSANDAEKWCKLCFGRLLKHQHLVNGEIDPNSEGSLPLVSILASMGQATIIKVLQYHVNWLEATGFTSHQGRWLYALMTALQKPLIPEVCSTIRTLARLASQIRATLSPGEEHERRIAELNLLICLVARYFDQTDLLDDEVS